MGWKLIHQSNKAGLVLVHSLKDGDTLKQTPLETHVCPIYELSKYVHKAVNHLKKIQNADKKGFAITCMEITHANSEENIVLVMDGEKWMIKNDKGLRQVVVDSYVFLRE